MARPDAPDVDRHDGVLHVRRVYIDGRVKLYGKQMSGVAACGDTLSRAGITNSVLRRSEVQKAGPFVRVKSMPDREP